MKTGKSSLNPYAASYVPLFKRGAAEGNTGFGSSGGPNSENEAVRFGHQPQNFLGHSQHFNVSQSYVQGTGVAQASQISPRKGHHSGEFYASTSQYPNEVPGKSNFDEFDMDLAYLQMTFPGISEESLSDVYLANRFDLDAAVDMLHQLEIHPDDSSDKLPDTLDIGDVPESRPSTEVGPQIAKDAASEAAASTSQ